MDSTKTIRDLPGHKATTSQLKKELVYSVLDAGITEDMMLSRLVDLVAVIESRKSTKTLKQRPGGLGMTMIRYPGYWITKEHKQIFRRWDPMMAIRPVEGRELPTTHMTFIEKTSHAAERGASCRFDLNVVRRLRAVLAETTESGKEDYGMGRHQVERFFAMVNAMTNNLNDSFYRGEIDEALQFAWKRAKDVTLRRVLRDFTEVGGVRDFVFENGKVARAVKEYYAGSNGSIGQLNKDHNPFVSAVTWAANCVDSVCLASPYDKGTSDLLEKGDSGVKCLREDNELLRGVLIVGAQTLERLHKNRLLKQMTLVQDVRHVVMDFSRKDYQIAAATEWVLPRAENERRQVAVRQTLDMPDPYQTDDQNLMKKVVRGTIDPDENQVGTCEASVMKLANGHLVVVDTLRDVYEDINRTKNHPLEGTITLSTATLLGAMAGTDKPYMKIGMRDMDDGGTTWLNYGHTMPLLCCKRMFDNLGVERQMNRPQSTFPYDDYATAHYKNLKSENPANVRCPAVTGSYARINECGTRNHTDSPTLRDQRLASSCEWASDIALELHPFFRFFVTDRQVGKGEEYEWQELAGGKDDNMRGNIEKEGIVRAYPVHVQGNMPLAYTGDKLRRAQALQLMTDPAGVASETAGLYMWRKSLNATIYPSFFYLLEIVLAEKHANAESVVRAYKESDNSLEHITMVLADTHWRDFKTLVFPAKRFLLEAWRATTECSEVRTHIDTIMMHVSKQSDILLGLSTRLTLPGINVQEYLSPLTDWKSPVPVNMNGSYTNTCVLPAANPVGYEAQYYTHHIDNGNARYEWRGYADAKASRFEDHVLDKVFFNNVLALTGGRVHTGYVTPGPDVPAQCTEAGRFQWIPLAAVC